MRASRWRLLILFCLATGSVLGPGAPARSQTISLDGDWHFLADPAGTLKVADLASASNVRPTRVPSSWQAQFADLRDYAGVAWYWRSASLEPPAPDRVVLLRFGAVDYLAEVYVNGDRVGAHEGGYLPFEFDVTSRVRPGENEIAVRVADPGAKPSEVEGIKYAEIPHGKQNWYVQTSGLWQDVELDIRPRMHLASVHVSAGADGAFKISVPVVNLPAEGQFKNPAYVGAEIRDPADKAVWKEARDLSPGQARYEFAGKLPSPSLWSPANPALYTLHVWLSSGDNQYYRFGFRSFETRGGKFYLNGQIVYLRAALDQDFYPETIYTSPSLDYLKSEMQQVKALGLNMLRCHIKVPDPRYLQAADEAGVLVWYEIPNWDKLTDDSKRRARETLGGMIERDWNHPSLVIVSIINESWGADLREAPQREWLKLAYGEAKAMVPGWLVVDNSACCENFHLATDIADFHQYNAIPDYASDFDRLVADMAQRPGWLFSIYGDAAPRGDEPLMLSAFGNWGLPRLPESKPWWFARAYGNRGMTLPEGVEERFAEHQYSSLFPDFNALAEAAQWHQYRALKYEIETLRSHPEIQGYVITEFTDLNWEADGLLDMWRRPKAHARELQKLQQDDLLIVRAEKRNLTSGETAQADVYFSHYSLNALANAQATWEVDGTALRGSLAVPAVSPGTVAGLGKIEFTVPSEPTPAKRLLKVRLSAGTKLISETSLDSYFYPPKAAELPPPVSFHDPTGRLRRLVNEMRARNYLAPTGSEALPVLVTSIFDDEVKKTLQGGGRVILLASDRQTLAPGIEIVPRAGSDLDGNWISSFLWIRKDRQPFTLVGFETFPGFETQAVTPSAVVQGVKPEAFDDVLAGIFYGWIHSNVGVLVQARCGQGKLLISTFSLGTTYGTDPYATYLLDAMVQYIVSGPAPALEIPLSAP
jgi:hypothetical protein